MRREYRQPLNLWTFGVVAAITLFTLPCVAQAPDDDDGGALLEAGELESTRERVKEKIERAKLDFLAEQLALTDSEKEGLSALLESQADSEKTAQKRVRKARRALAEGLERDSTSDEELQTLVGELESAKEAMETARRAIFDEAKEILPVRKHAKLVLALPAFQKKMEKLVKKARQMGKKGEGKRGKGKKNKGKRKKFKKDVAPGK